ncbi:DUF6000 family protein [Streptomyces diastatochromogenes]|uniref:DUF6000 family protein n=1 Tax=Streptomyces diastatochromogenes TaxID=42236 RepID=UPI0036757D38
MPALSPAAMAVSDAELTTLFEGSWRERRTAAWLAAVSRRDHFRERLGALLVESEVCCAGGAYCVALASFGTARDADLLAAYLDRYLRRPDLAYDQPTAMGVLAYIDSFLHGDGARPCFRSGSSVSPRTVMISVWGEGIFLMTSGQCCARCCRSRCLAGRRCAGGS